MAPQWPAFQPRATTLLRVVPAGVGLLAASAAYAMLQYYHSPYWNGVGLPRSQPVLFSTRMRAHSRTGGSVDH